MFQTRPDRPWCPPSLLYIGNCVSFSGVKRSGRGVNLPTHLQQILKKQESYNSLPLWASMACYRVNFMFYFWNWSPRNEAELIKFCFLAGHSFQSIWFWGGGGRGMPGFISDRAAPHISLGNDVATK
jgi:hypothetical protein